MEKLLVYVLVLVRGVKFSQSQRQRAGSFTYPIVLLSTENNSSEEAIIIDPTIDVVLPSPPPVSFVVAACVVP
jgi:hypothetical protein